MMRIQSFVILIGCMCLLQACTFSVPQAESAFRQMSALATSEGEPKETLWLASFQGEGAVLKPYLAEGYTVFANESGAAVAFDGWVVRSVLGFGQKHYLKVSDEGWVRSSEMNNQRFAANCAPWQKQDLADGYQWRQICGINGHETIIDIDEAGSITRVRQAFGADLGTLELHLRRE